MTDKDAPNEAFFLFQDSETDTELVISLSTLFDCLTLAKDHQIVPPPFDE